MAKILMIEDEDQIREEVMDWLMFEGYEVVGAANGRLGLEAAEREYPDLIISDINMPEMDGYNVLLEVRSNPVLSHIPFIFLTAHDTHDAYRAGMEMGADDYLTKPFTHTEVLSAIRARLQKQSQQKEYVNQQLDTLDKVLEEERAKRLVKSRLVAMFSHDFRNPLAVILSSATLMQKYEDRMDSDQRQNKLSRIVSSVEQLMQMLDDMLVVAEMESGRFEANPENLDLTAQVENIVDEFRAIKGETCQIRFESSVQKRVKLDPKLLRQMTANLISNAIKYSPDGGEVKVKIAGGEGEIVLLVQDNGIGIPDEAMSSLFTPFFRATNAKNLQGTGLGLAIVKEAVDLCGGEIDVTSQVGQGSQFRVRLPSP